MFLLGLINGLANIINNENKELISYNKYNLISNNKLKCNENKK